MKSTGVVEVVITADDPEWLAGFTRRLVEDRLASARPAVCGAGWGGGRGVHSSILSYPEVFV